MGASVPANRECTWVLDYHKKRHVDCYLLSSVSSSITGYFRSPKLITTSDWTCVGGATSLAGRGCSTNLFAGQTLTSVWPAAIPTPDTSMPLPSQRMLTTWEITSNTSALCDAIPVLWQNTDIQILSLLGESTTTNVFPTSTSTSYSSTMTMAIPTATGVTSNAPEVSSRDSNMPQGAKIGIGVTIPSVLTALILGLFVYFRRRDGQQQFEDAGEELRSHTDDTDWSYLDTSRKQELPSEGLPAEMDANRETRELESLRIIHEMADTSIPGVSMRDTSNNPILRNYITDIISKPVAVAGPDILNNLIPGEESPGCRPPRNDTREIETSNSTRTIRQASTWNRDQTEAAPSLADASHYREDFSNNLSANNNNTSTAVISSTSDAHQSPPSPTTLNHYVLRSPSAREIDQGHEMSTVSPVSSGPPRWFSITSIADWSPTDSRLNNGSDEIVSPLNAGPQRRYSVAFRADPSSAVPSLPRVPQRPPSPPPVSTTPPLGLSTPTSCSSPQPQHSPPPSSNSPI